MEQSSNEFKNFGKNLKNEMFYLDKNVYFTNHGSYGAVPKKIFEKYQQLELELESSPDIWFRYKTNILWNENRKALAKYLAVDDENIVLTVNATDAINSILKSIDFNESNDAILIHEYTYPAIRNAVEYVSQYRLKNENHLKIIKIPSIYPVESVETLLENFNNICQDIIITQKLKLRLIILDHISSATATLYPIEEMIKIIRKWNSICNYNTTVLIDGAHAIGHIEVKLNNIDCDFYVSNLHKWFLSPRGCAFLYFKDKNESSYKLMPNIISHDYNKKAVESFIQRGTWNNTSLFLIKDCIEFYENYFGGLRKIGEYAIKILENAVEILVKSWRTSMLHMPKELEAPFMKIIKLPQLFEENNLTTQELLSKSLKLVKILHEDYNVDAQIVPIDHAIYVRISCFVYNSIDDYLALRDAVLDIMKTRKLA